MKWSGLSFARNSKIMLFIAGVDPRTAHLHTAFFFAVMLHLLLAILLPDLPELKLPVINRESGMSVFLRERQKDKKFNQSLNQKLPNPEFRQPLLRPMLGASSPIRGDDPQVTESAARSDAQPFDTLDTQTTGSKTTRRLQPPIRIDRAMIKLFAKSEAIREVERNPDELARFKRSFNSRRSDQRRSISDNYRNRYGDYYVRNRSSAGDICFVQKQEGTRGEFSTNTVYFYRCDSKPLGLVDSPLDKAG